MESVPTLHHVGRAYECARCGRESDHALECVRCLDDVCPECRELEAALCRRHVIVRTESAARLSSGTRELPSRRVPCAGPVG